MTEVGTNYGGALYDLAASEGLSQEILTQLQALNESFVQEPGFSALLCAHSLSKAERCKILDDSFAGKVHPYVLNFLKILTERGYARQFGDCCKAYKEQYNEDNGILTVQAVSAVALTQEQSARLTQKLSKLTGKTVELTNRVDPAVLGGVRLDYDGKRVDGTVKNRLDTVRELLKNTVI
jgi:F-type H+-transporting ATPase subunit delta